MGDERVRIRTDRMGWRTESTSFSYDWHQTVLYALGVGAGPEQLDYVYEARGPLVVPSFALLAAMEPVHRCLQTLQVPVEAIVHGGQRLELFSKLLPADQWKTVAQVRNVYDVRKFARVIIETETKRSTDGQLVARSEWDILVRDAGGFGGPSMPRTPVVRPPKDLEPSFRFEHVTSRRSALIYRLSGDTNPLHIDPEVAAAAGFERGPILHGLATFGIVARAVVDHACGGEPSRLRSLSARFSRPVWPGDRVVVEGWQQGGDVTLRVSAGDPQQVVLSGCQATVDT